jgi:dTDP-4-dehydrorhamnose 3,5-epimerase
VRFIENRLKGLFVIEPERLEDPRGFFARTWCQREFAAQSLNALWVQCSISFNERSGTLRGLHCQASPHEETKLVRCTMGAIYDVVVDLRPNSESFKQWEAVELTAENRRMLYIPEGFAHGFQTLTNRTEVFYQISAFYSPAASRGYRYDDPTFAIQWPRAIAEISEKDRSWPLIGAERCK